MQFQTLAVGFYFDKVSSKMLSYFVNFFKFWGWHTLVAPPHNVELDTIVYPQKFNCRFYIPCSLHMPFMMPVSVQLISVTLLVR